ncbi:hypothetical protein CVT24_000845 [Panaeolus cyanescens]|uniref:Actin cytoskeleton-regulatory complex protein PAN1 n=1 Tax=Panaeolus cyanescens TaxID=181874 RepID=A0A409VVJ3_9AGAR|nr:hypothetical protein CVT24_000845 [Panaeolus cyanescens]
MSTNFSPTPAELTLVSQIFAQADPQKLGVLTGDVAVRVFSGAKLPAASLGEIWNIADDGNNGWLSKKGVAMAVRLIGWAQKGEAITTALLNKPGPLAVIEGVSVVSRQSTGVSSPRSPPPVSFPPLSPQDKTKFLNMFTKSGPVNGLLSGEQARDIFVKSKLGTEQLMKIWNLADTQDRGALDATDFAIGMYFIQGLMTNKISTIPNSLPPGLYQQAGGGMSAIRSHVTGNSGSFSPVSSAFPPQHTGQSDVFAQRIQPNHTGMSGAFKPALPARPSILSNSNGHAHDWDVTPTEKASADRYFDTLDAHKHGYIEGEVAVPFMLKSQLPGEVLALIWDLADINNDGRLTRDGFAIAMHLIQKKLAGQEIPQTLPPSLLPPHLRSQLGSSPFSPATAQFAPQPEPQVDLFSFDDPPPSSIPVQTTGAGFATPVKNRPVDNDPFGASPFQPSVTARSPTTDFFGDDEPSGSPPPANDRSAEIGNLKNQLQSTTRSLETVKTERASVEQTLASQASQLSTIQTQLSSAKAAYDTETSLLATLKERYAKQTAEINQAREQLIRAESDLSAVRVEKSEIEGAFLRDKEEVRELHRNMIEVGKQADALKQDVEKLKKEAKQQKGLLAIARKQLSTKEAEKAKVEKEHEDAVAELNAATEEKEAVEAETAQIEADIASITSSPRAPKSQTSLSPSETLAFAAAQPLPSTPALEQQTPTPMKSNNPFERLAMSSGSGTASPRAQSPFSVTASPPPVNDTPKPASVMFFDSNEDFMEPPVKPDVSSPAEAPSKEEAGTSELSYMSEEAAPPNLDGVLSPNTELFVTPPTSANPNSSPSSNPAEKFPSLDDLLASLDTQAAATDKVPAQGDKQPFQQHKRKSTLGETDLNANLKEIEVEESDTDSDSDEDEKPLGTLKRSASPVAVTSPPPAKPVEEPAKAAPAPTTDFDDIFGTDEPTNGHAIPLTTNAEPAKDLFDFSKPDFENGKRESTLAGVSAFDETLSHIPGPVLPTPAKVSFNAFEDEFDFGKFNVDQAKAAAAANETKDASFDDIFNASTSSQPTTSPPPTNGTAVANPAPNGGAEFDDVFGLAVSTPAPEEQKPPQSPAPVPTAVPDGRPTPSTSPEPTSSSFSNVSSGITPRVASSSTTRSEITRQTSPPPRTLSPKPSRPSFSSSKDGHEKPKDPPAPRHSKLSIRLPFGKKKKQQVQEPLPQAPSQHLSPPMEEPRRTSTPASDDDVEAVKQLTAMGFSRGQAVEALEKYGYDVQRALNSLLK